MTFSSLPAASSQGCSDKEKDFMSKWKAKDKSEVAAQLERLNKMVSGSMKCRRPHAPQPLSSLPSLPVPLPLSRRPDLKKWVVQRSNILKQL